MAELHHEFQCRNRNNDSKDSAGIGEIMGGGCRIDTVMFLMLTLKQI